MDWTLSTGDFLRVGIIVYVAVWVSLRFREWKAGKDPECNVYKVAKYEKRSDSFKSWGWVIALLVACFSIIIAPTVLVVSQDNSVLSDDLDFPSSVRLSFKVKRLYVPFYYKGHYCEPFGRYILNETDSAFVLYPTYFFNGTFAHAGTVDKFIDVPAHSFMKWSKGINNKFEKPSDTVIGYVSESERNKETTEWTIDLREHTVRDCEEIAAEIKKRNEKLFRNLTPGSTPDSITIGGVRCTIRMPESITPIELNEVVSIQEMSETKYLNEEK